MLKLFTAIVADSDRRPRMWVCCCGHRVIARTMAAAEAGYRDHIEACGTFQAQRDGYGHAV